METFQNNLPLLSVIVPIYNGETRIPFYEGLTYIENCVQSLLTQNYPNLEIILVDDCSTDRTADICQELAMLHSEIRFVQNERNLGQSGGRNHGVRIAQGELITYVDVDDTLLPNTLMPAVQMLQSNADCDLVQVPTQMFTTEDNYEWWNKEKQLPPITVKSDNDREYLFEKWQLTRVINNLVWGKIYWRAFLVENNISFELGHFAEDMVYCVDLALHTRGVCFSTGGGYRYYLANQSTTRLEGVRGAEYTQSVFKSHVRCYWKLHDSGLASTQEMRNHEFLYKLGNAMFRYHRKQGKNILSTCIKEELFNKLSWAEILTLKRLTFKQKIKVILCKGYAAFI